MSVAERRKKEKEARRAHIVAAAERLFHERSPEHTTMEDVAEAAQLGKGTLYLYFETKEDLLLAIATRHQQAMLERFEREAQAHEEGFEAVRAVLLTYARHMSSPIEHLRMVMTRWVSGVPFPEGRVPDQMRQNLERLHAVVCDTIARGQADGSIRDDEVPPRLAMKLWSGVNGALLMKLKLACVPRLELLQQHAAELEEQVDFVMEAARPALRHDRPRTGAAGRRMPTEVPQ
jgi:AcrR family transcriptional regulator